LAQSAPHLSSGMCRIVGRHFSFYESSANIYDSMRHGFGS
jgi:hypothetical protein